MELVLAFLAGLLVGAIITSIVIYRKTKTDGDLRIDRSDSDGPYLFLELSNAIDTVSRKKRVIFNVINKDYLPRK